MVKLKMTIFQTSRKTLNELVILSIPSMKKTLFFITGRGRSGTWLLKSILDTHTDLCVAPEALFIMHLYQKYHQETNWTQEKLKKFFDDLMLEERVKRWWKIDEEALKSQILQQKPNVTFGELCQLVYWQYSRQHDKKEDVYLGDKNPGYTLFMDKLLNAFPKAKFIHMVRDPRDNVMSFQKASFDLNNSAALAYRWQSYNKKALKFIDKHPDKCIIVRFEDLLSDSENTLQKICKFLGVEYTPDLLTFYKNPKNVFEWNKKVAEPLDGKAAYKWKSKMSQEQQEEINYICEEMIRYFNYEIPDQVDKKWASTVVQQNVGRTADILEQFIFSLPTDLRMKILNVYRTKTNTINT